MGRKGNCYDNAIAESFFKTLKTELVHQNKYETRDHAKNSVFEYIIKRHNAYNPTKYYFGTFSDTANGLPNLELRFTYEYNSNTNQFVTYIKDVNETKGEINIMNVDEFIELFRQSFWDAHPYYHSIVSHYYPQVQIYK